MNRWERSVMFGVIVALVMFGVLVAVTVVTDLR